MQALKTETPVGVFGVAARRNRVLAGLASALQKLQIASKRMPLPASPATAHLFIMKPFTGQSLMELFSTHPPTEKRIERLREEFGQF